VVTAVAGQTVHSTHELQELVERAPFGSRQQLSVMRDGKPVTLAVEVQAMPKTYGTASAGRSRSQEDEQSTYKNRELGLELSDLTPELAARLGMKGVQGALVTGVADDSLAADAGLRQGMVILKVGHTPVANAEDFEKAMKNESLKSGVLLLVRAGGSNRFLVLPQK
jgi:serine protease Do